MTLIVLCLCFMVTIGTGDILPQLSSEITKLGFHREIHRKLTFPVALLPGLVPGGDVECHVMFDESIPAGAYMDPYQLENLRMFGGLNVEIHDQVDLEAPEFESSAIHVSVFSNLSLIGDSWQAGYVFPVHIRYHGISDSSEFVRVKFITPSVAIRCQDTTYQMTFYGYGGPIHSQQSRLCSRGSPILCDWMFIQTEKVANDISVDVPVGKMADTFLVLVVTMVTTLGACAALVAKAVDCGKYTMFTMKKVS